MSRFVAALLLCAQAVKAKLLKINLAFAHLTVNILLKFIWYRNRRYCIYIFCIFAISNNAF